MSHPRKQPKRAPTTLSGRWDIVQMDELDEDYFDLGEEPPCLTITRAVTEDGRGEYAIGLSTGSLDGALRTFGNETVFIFASAGMDEMDPVDGAGWIRRTGPDTLEGEFLGVLGRFTAQRNKAPRRAHVERRRR
ncbi:MAG: hypothetical protein IT318_01615 [Anaerolineales bacterium]|nr:hypothetical protein [Anaerolineales bacterium]